MLKITDRQVAPEDLKLTLLGRTIHTIKTLSEGTAAKFDVNAGAAAGGKKSASSTC